MGAPKGNQFWKLRSKHGRDKLFATPELLWDAACEYFEWCTNNPILDPRNNQGAKIPRPFTIDGFLLYVGASRNYLFEFKRNCTKDFLAVIVQIEQTIYNQKFEHAAVGIFKDNLIARDLGLSDKQAVQQLDENGNPMRPENNTIIIAPPK